jgi:hypothetical protein
MQVQENNEIKRGRASRTHRRSHRRELDHNGVLKCLRLDVHPHHKVDVAKCGEDQLHILLAWWAVKWAW